MKKAKVNDLLTDGKRKWQVISWGRDSKIAVPLTRKSFELWANCELEKVAVIPGLRIIK
jgi:hypothetical protein